MRRENGMQYLSKCVDCGAKVIGTYKRKYCDRCLKRHLSSNFRQRREKFEAEFKPYSKRCLICGRKFDVFNYNAQSQKYCDCCKNKTKYYHKKSEKQAKKQDIGGLVAVAASIVGKSYGNFVADNYNNPDFDAYVLKIIRENKPNLLKKGKDKNEIQNK